MRYVPFTLGGSVITLAIPESLSEKATGLLGLQTLTDDKGLSYLPCPTLHTVGMQFPIDILWLDADGGIVDYDQMVEPGRIVTPKSNWAIELAGGWVTRNWVGSHGH